MAEADGLYWQLVGRARFLRANHLDPKSARLMDAAALRLKESGDGGAGSACEHRANVRSINPDHLGNNFECLGCGARTPMPGFSPWTTDHLPNGMAGAKALQPQTAVAAEQSPFVTWGD